MADTGDNPSSDEELSKKERERRFKNHLQCKRTSNGSKETSVDKKNPKKRKINKLWTEEETIELIEQLESRPCLWDVYHATYSKRFSSSETASSDKMTTIATSLVAIFV